MQTGMIGLGAMGANMAKNLNKAGHLHLLWNRTESTATKLAEELNVQVAQDLTDMAAKTDIILLCVSADQDVLDIVTALATTIRPGSIVVDMSTVSCDTVRQATDILEKKQTHFLDAPVSGGVEGAKNGTLAIMVGGDQAALEKVQPILEAIGSRIMYMGETGSGQKAKAVNQIMAAGINQAVTEALAFGEALALPMGKVIDIISAGAAGNWFMQHRGPSMIQGRFTPGFKLALHHKDLKICKKLAEKTGAITPLLDMTLTDYEKLMQDDYADEDISALYRLKKL